jgi:vacuolar-type H+-ATPase subunit H
MIAAGRADVDDDERIEEARKLEEDERQRLREAQAEAKETLEEAERLEEEATDSERS